MFSDSIKTFFATALFTGFIAVIVTKLLDFDVLTSIYYGLFFGFILGFYFFVLTIIIIASGKIELEKGEIFYRKCGANHFLNFEAVGGRLFLTNKRLHFKAHFFNFQAHELIIPLSDIDSIRKATVCLIIRNRIIIKLKNGKEEFFMLWNRSQWVKEIDEARSADEIYEEKEMKPAFQYKLTTVDQNINSLEYPSILRRYLATFIDGTLILMVLFLSSFVFSADNNYVVALRIGLILSMVLIYEPLCTSKLCTIGQLIMGIRVRRISTLGKISLIQAYARILVKVSLGLISLFTIILSAKKRAIHDFISRSIVVVV